MEFWQYQLRHAALPDAEADAAAVLGKLPLADGTLGALLGSLNPGWHPDVCAMVARALCRIREGLRMDSQEDCMGRLLTAMGRFEAWPDDPAATRS